MRELLAKVARLAVSKGAAFCYAVTVGVSGQLAYNYLQPRDPVPKPAAVAVPGAAAIAPIPGAAPSETAMSPATLASVPAPVAKPASDPPAATAPILPEPPSLSLPSPAALPAPALKPTALPSRLVAVTPVEPSDAPVAPAASATADPTPLPDMPRLRDRAAETVRSAGTADAAVAAPVPLLPGASAAEVEKAAVPLKPGPGSGGLY